MYNIKIRTNTFCALILNQNIKRKTYYVGFKRSLVAVRKMDKNRYFIKVTECLSVCSEGTCKYNAHLKNWKCMVETRLKVVGLKYEGNHS